MPLSQYSFDPLPSSDSVNIFQLCVSEVSDNLFSFPIAIFSDGDFFKRIKASFVLEALRMVSSVPLAHSSFFSSSHWKATKKRTMKEVRKRVYMSMDPVLF